MRSRNAVPWKLQEAFLASQKHENELARTWGKVYCEFLLDLIHPIPEWSIEICRNRIRSVIEGHHDHFEATKNPLYALKAYQQAREIGDLPPEWVLTYLDQGINTFLATYSRRKAQVNITDTFGKSFRITKAMIRSYRRSIHSEIGWRALSIARKRARAGLSINES